MESFGLGRPVAPVGLGWESGPIEDCIWGFQLFEVDPRLGSRLMGSEVFQDMDTHWVHEP